MDQLFQHPRYIQEYDEYDDCNCRSECENPDHHHGLEHCPEEVATSLMGSLEELKLTDAQEQDFWNHVHDGCMEYGTVCDALLHIFENGGQEGAENLYRLHAL